MTSPEGRSNEEILGDLEGLIVQINVRLDRMSQAEVIRLDTSVQVLETIARLARLIAWTNSPASTTLVDDDGNEHAIYIGTPAYNLASFGRQLEVGLDEGCSAYEQLCQSSPSDTPGYDLARLASVNGDVLQSRSYESLFKIDQAVRFAQGVLGEQPGTDSYPDLLDQPPTQPMPVIVLDEDDADISTYYTDDGKRR